MVDTTYLRKNYFDQDPNNEIAKQFGEDVPEDEFAVGEKLKEENYYKFHENMSNYDPKG